MSLRRRGLLLAAALPALASAAPVLRVGPDRAVRTLAHAAREARDGQRIEVDAGDYVADVAVWPQHGLSLRAVGGRVRVIAAGAQVEGKGLFVTRGRGQRIEGFDFIGARVPDRNGAGIRVEAGSLALRDCGFQDNENGLLTSNDPDLELDLEDCDFGPIAPGLGQTHNCYVGRIRRLAVSACWFHQGFKGHLLKSRAALSLVLYNRLYDEIGGRASYELEFPNGGVAVVMGNLIGQSATTENACVISYGAEGLLGPAHGLHLVHNTLVDGLPGGGSWLRVAAGMGRVQLVSNLLLGRRGFDTEAHWDARNNAVVDWDAFVQAAREDYRLKPGSPLRGRVVDAGAAAGLALAPVREYRHPHGSVALAAAARCPGAFQG